MANFTTRENRKEFMPKLEKKEPKKIVLGFNKIVTRVKNKVQ